MTKSTISYTDPVANCCDAMCAVKPFAIYLPSLIKATPAKP